MGAGDACSHFTIQDVSYLVAALIPAPLPKPHSDIGHDDANEVKQQITPIPYCWELKLEEALQRFLPQSSKRHHHKVEQRAKSQNGKRGQYEQRRDEEQGSMTNFVG